MRDHKTSVTWVSTLGWDKYTVEPLSIVMNSDPALDLRWTEIRVVIVEYRQGWRETKGKGKEKGRKGAGRLELQDGGNGQEGL